MKLVNKIAVKKSKWKIVEKEFVQGHDVSKIDAWKFILLSDLFPKVFLSFHQLYLILDCVRELLLWKILQTILVKQMTALKKSLKLCMMMTRRTLKKTDSNTDFYQL